MGNVGLGRNVNAISRDKNDFNFVFEKMSPWLIQNDLNSINLESPIYQPCPTVRSSTFKFCGDTKFAPVLANYKIFANLANNHILNYGQEGLALTKKLLSDNMVDFVYSHQKSTEFAQKTINGITVGFLGFDLTGSQSRPTDLEIINLVKKYDPQVDHLVVHIHGGNEYEPVPENWKQDFYRQLVDVGADIVQGHHPHVWQGSEIYKGKYIYFSLGNFIFDQSWSHPTSQSYAIRLVLSKDKIISETKQAYEILFNSQPNPVEKLTAYPFNKKDIL